jgi:hypothetical protein
MQHLHVVINITLPEVEFNRFLHLLPFKDENAVVQCQLSAYPLREPGKQALLYDASAYVWEKLEKTRHIRIDQLDLLIHSNGTFKL